MSLRSLKAKPVPLETPEAVLNLWAYVDEGGHIFRLAGKAYVMDGNESDKLALLRQLSKTDFLSTPWHKVPSNFAVIGPGNNRIEAIADTSMLSDPLSIGSLFAHLMEHLAKSMPTQLRCVGGDFKPFRLDLPKDPLTVTTVVLEYDDGRLIPMISTG